MKGRWKLLALALAAVAAALAARGDLVAAGWAWLLGAVQAVVGQLINRRAARLAGRDGVMWPLAAHGAKALAVALVLVATRDALGPRHTTFVVAALACYFVLLFAEVADLQARAGRPRVQQDVTDDGR